MSLYGKYRPQNFANLVGQDHIRETLLNEIAQGTLTHAYLLAGPRGTGKTSSARLVAKALNCTNRNENGEPCDACELCTLIRDGGCIDVLEIDAASNRGIDEIRDLKEKIDYAPSQAKSKIYIIDEVHMLTKEAFNALLKTLEEPPSSVYFILCTTEVHKIPETIISRCQRFDFKRVDPRMIQTRLNYIAQNEGIEAEEKAIDLISHHVEGGMRDAIGLFEQLTINKKLMAQYVSEHLGITGNETVEKLITLLEEKNATGAIEIINNVYAAGHDLPSFLREVLEILRQKMIQAVHKNDANIGKWLAMIEDFEKSKDMMRTATIPQLPLEIAAIRICGMGQQTTVVPVQVQPRAPIAISTPLIKPRPAAAPLSPALAAPRPAPVMQQTPTEQKAATIAETETASAIQSEIANEVYRQPGALRQHWKRVIEHVATPSLRRSLEQCQVVERGEEDIELIFQTKFHMDRVNTLEFKGSISKSIEHIFQRRVKITCLLMQLPGETKTREKAEKPLEAKKETPKPAVNDADLEAKAFELFASE